jgi:IS5 family transposase
MARQASIVDPSFASGGRITRRKAFLDQMDSVVPWADLVAIVDAKRPKAGRRGRQPWPTEVLLRMLLVQAWLNLSDEAAEDAMYDSLAVREFVGSGNEVPDATTLLRFRHMVEREELDIQIEDSIRERLDSRGLLMHGGSCIDATIVEAPSSTKNRSGSRDPEMHQTKKGNQWHHGMKCHAATDAGTGCVVAETYTAANVSDVAEAAGLVREDDEVVYADAGYRGIGKRPEVVSDPHLSEVEFRVAARPSELREMAEHRPQDRHAERRKASVRAHVEHVFHILKQTFGYSKVRYRGLRKNGCRMRILFASANMLMVARARRQADFLGPAIA